MPIRVVSVRRAKLVLSALLHGVEQGKEIVITRRGRPVAKLVRLVSATRRDPGSWRRLKGWKDFRYDPALFAPMGDRKLREEGWP